ncbi:MAG: autotransporter domain-containing protein, partial [Caulobacteraceae bacterium]
QVFGAWGHTNGNGDAGDVSRSSGGFLLGLDVPVAQQWRVGGFLGYSQTGLTMDAQTASADIDSYHVGAYGGGQLGPLGLRFGATYTTHDISTDRTVALPNETDQLQANYSGHTVQGFAEIGWRLQMQRLGLEPFANVAYVTVHTASFSETGGVAAVSGAASDTDATYTTLGLRPSLDLAVGPVQARVRGVLGWRHDFGDITPTSTVRFVEGGAAFSVDGAPIERDAGVAEMALDLKTSSVTVLSLSYGAQGWDGDIDQTIRANFHLSF